MSLRLDYKIWVQKCLHLDIFTHTEKKDIANEFRRYESRVMDSKRFVA